MKPINTIASLAGKLDENGQPKKAMSAVQTEARRLAKSLNRFADEIEPGFATTPKGSKGDTYAQRIAAVLKQSADNKAGDYQSASADVPATVETVSA